LNNMNYSVFKEGKPSTSSISFTPEQNEFMKKLLAAMLESKDVAFSKKYLEYVKTLFDEIHIIKKENGKECASEVLQLKNTYSDFEVKLRVCSFDNKLYGTIYVLFDFESGGLTYNSSLSSGKRITFKTAEEMEEE